MDQKKIIINYVEALYRIPSIWPIFYHHILGVLEEHRQQLEAYGIIDKGAALNPNDSQSPIEKSKPVEYKMERKGNRWEHEIIDGDESKPDLFPEALFKYIAGLKNEETLFMVKNQEIKGVPGREFDITAVWESPDLITGTIAEKGNPTIKEENDIEREGKEKKGDRQKMAVLFKHMDRYPQIYKHIMDEFELVLLPLVEKSS